MSFSNAVATTWEKVTERERFRDRWVCDETFFKVMKADYPDLDHMSGNGFNWSQLNTSLASIFKLTIDDFTPSNQTGKFRRAFKRACPYDENQRRRVWYYYIGPPPFIVERPVFRPPVPLVIWSAMCDGWLLCPQDCCFQNASFYCVAKQQYLNRKSAGQCILGKPPHDNMCPIRPAY